MARVNQTSELDFSQALRENAVDTAAMPSENMSRLLRQTETQPDRPHEARAYGGPSNFIDD
jgi:hypothetical protein